MLLEFRVKNFRSIGDEQVLSLVANADTEHRDTHCVKTGLAPTAPYAVRSAAIYGPNASGKTNLLRALFLFRSIVKNSAKQNPGEPIPWEPFRFDPAMATAPTEMEITFLLDNKRYQYGFAWTDKEITEEWLTVYATAKPQKWLQRTRQDFNFRKGLPGENDAIAKRTLENTLYLSKAAQDNHPAFRPIFKWIDERLVTVKHHSMERTRAALEDELKRNKIAALLISADVGIGGVKVVSESGWQIKARKENDTPEPKLDLEKLTRNEPRFVHKIGNESFDFELHDESDGTKKLYVISEDILEALEKGGVLLFDEIEENLHPHIVREIIKMFHDPERNRGNAQLVFTTHNTSFLDTDLFRRDQIWFTEKDATQATHLYPLTDYHPRKNEALEKGYLMGRYGAVPFWSDLHFDGCLK